MSARVIFNGFSGDCRLADVRFYSVSVQPTGAGLKALRLDPCDSSFQTGGLESCATNSPIMNGLPSNPCCRTSRVVFLGLTTVVSSLPLRLIEISQIRWRLISLGRH